VIPSGRAAQGPFSRPNESPSRAPSLQRPTSYGRRTLHGFPQGALWTSGWHEPEGSSPLSDGTVTWEELCPTEAPPPPDPVLPCRVAQLTGGPCPCCFRETSVPHSCGDIQQARFGAS